MANLNFKYGIYKNLPSLSKESLGTVYITTDEQAMYVDLQVKEDEKQVAKRLRIGDIIVYQSAYDPNFKPPYQVGFYYFVASNALMRYDGKAWKQVNSVSTIEADISGLKTTVNTEIERSINKDNEHDRLIDANTQAIDQRVLTTEFDSFKSNNTEAIEAAKTIGTNAASAAQNAQTTANSALDLANAALPMSGTPEGKAMSGSINMGDKAITNLADLTSSSDGKMAVNKNYVDSKEASLTELINDSKDQAESGIAQAQEAKTAADNAQAAATSAQAAAVEAKAAADAAQVTADQGVADAESALAAAEARVLTTDFESFQSSNTEAIAAVASNVATVQTAANSALDLANAALPKSGGTMTGPINMGGEAITNLADLTSGSAGTTAANKNYVDNTVTSAISNAIAANDAMTFIGVLGTGDGQIKALPTSANVGDTYKVGTKGKYGSIDAKVGDLIINGAEKDSDTPDWIPISSGYEDDYLQKLVVDTSTIYLTDGITNTGTTGAVSGIKFVDKFVDDTTSSNIEFTIKAGAGDKPVHEVKVNMVWGTFD